SQQQSYQGGAIYLEQEGKLSLLDTVFRDNYAKKRRLQWSIQRSGARRPWRSYLLRRQIDHFDERRSILRQLQRDNGDKRGTTGEGGAIKLEGGSLLYINSDGAEDRTIFDGNHNYVTASNVGGYQGGAIEATNSIIRAYNVDFVVKAALIPEALSNLKSPDRNWIITS
ncbi:hypothetical protein, partial [Suipraeoptans intestinalis]|uniref:hypothetical protein n=1 Tax=Suipraeoptans intestinalis TaxID=2606628 RepID=UPI001565A096